MRVVMQDDVRVIAEQKHEIRYLVLAYGNFVIFVA